MDNLRLFEGFFYGALGVQTISIFVGMGSSTGLETKLGLAIVCFAAVLVWAAARKAQLWAAVVLAILTLFAGVVVADSLFEFLAPDEPHTTSKIEKALDAISVLMMIVGLFFYFTAKRRSASTAAEPPSVAGT